MNQSIVYNDIELATLKQDTSDFDPSDIDPIQKAIDDTGENSCGVIGIDVWTVHDDGKLHHFGDGLNWVSPIFRRQLMDSDSPKEGEKLKILECLENVLNPDYFIPPISTNGVGLAGNIWHDYNGVTRSTRYFREYLVWRDVKSYCIDPDQVQVPRMTAIGEVFGKVAGIPFNIDGNTKGIVLYYARTGAEEDTINTAVNSSFLRMASHNIGSNFAMSQARIRRVTHRKEHTKSIMLNLKLAFRAANVIMGTIEEKSTSSEKKIDDAMSNLSLELDTWREPTCGLEKIYELLKSFASFTAKKIHRFKR